MDLNAPLSKDSPPVVADATRLRAACPTINFLAEKGAKVVLASHLGRPKKQVVDGLRMDPVGAKLSELLGKEVRACCVGTVLLYFPERGARGDVGVVKKFVPQPQAKASTASLFARHTPLNYRCFCGVAT